jgi:hypothetical protein
MAKLLYTTENGLRVWGPPYTKAEVAEFYRSYSDGMASGKARVIRGHRPASSSAPPPQPQQEARPSPKAPRGGRSNRDRG